MTRVMDNKALIDTFYISFAKGNAESMVNCYSDDIEFEDPAFGKLRGEEAKNMWRMLVGNAGGKIVIKYNNVRIHDNYGSVDWTAEYVFSKTGRKVKNVIHAEFEFKDGKIVRHTDTFNFHRWAGQALGLTGKLLGRTSFLRNRVRDNARKALAKFGEER